jgi:hypothetical protein
MKGIEGPYLWQNEALRAFVEDIVDACDKSQALMQQISTAFQGITLPITAPKAAMAALRFEAAIRADQRMMRRKVRRAMRMLHQ